LADHLLIITDYPAEALDWKLAEVIKQAFVVMLPALSETLGFRRFTGRPAIFLGALFATCGALAPLSVPLSDVGS
jgi:hypothetical protein